MLRRAVGWVWGNVLGILIMVYFLLKVTVLFVLWIICGPLAFLFMLFGSDAVFSFLEDVLGGMDKVAGRVYDRLNFLPDD